MKRTLCTLTLATLPLASVEAAPIAYEGFDYLPGNFGRLVNENGGTGFNGAWTGSNNPRVVVDQSLSFGDLETSGDQLQYGAMSWTRSLSSTTGSGTAYISFLIQVDNPFSNNRWSGLTLMSDSTEVFSIGDTTGSSNASISVGGLANGNSVPVTSAQAANTTLTTERFLVARIDFDASGSNENVSLFVDPDLNAEPGTADATLTNVADFSFNGIRIHRGNTAGGNFTQLDEIRIGTTYADVTPSLTAIPEPTSMLIGSIGLGMAMMRRRRSN